MSGKWESYEMEAFLTISRYSKEAGGRREGRREGVENEVVRESGVRAWWTTIRNLHCVLSMGEAIVYFVWRRDVV